MKFQIKSIFGDIMDVIVSKEDIINIEKLKIISELAPIRERIKMFERKYNCSIEEFKKKLEESEEDFETWDDYIEWLSYEKKLKELERKLKEVENAERVKIA